MSKESLCHVARAPLPWRPAWQTECGLRIDSGAPVMTREEFIAKVKREGQQRAAFSTCMTCWQTSSRHMHPEVDDEERSLRALNRELDWYRKDGREILKADISAISILIKRYRAEFDELVEDYKATVKLPAIQGRRTQ